MLKFYDNIISLGQYCSCSVLLREIGLQDFSFPFDWSAGTLECSGKGGLKIKIKLICNDFKNFFDKENFV